MLATLADRIMMMPRSRTLSVRRRTSAIALIPSAMNSRQATLGLLGAILMGWGGAYISTRLDGSALTTMSVLAFAFGVFCFCLLAISTLSARVAKLERALREASAPATPLT